MTSTRSSATEPCSELRKRAARPGGSPAFLLFFDCCGGPGPFTPACRVRQCGGAALRRSRRRAGAGSAGRPQEAAADRAPLCFALQTQAKAPENIQTFRQTFQHHPPQTVFPSYGAFSMTDCGREGRCALFAKLDENSHENKSIAKETGVFLTIIRVKSIRIVKYLKIIENSLTTGNVAAIM